MMQTYSYVPEPMSTPGEWTVLILFLLLGIAIASYDWRS